MRITVEQAIEQLEAGEVIALPTETVYGLSASLRHLSAVEQLYTLKGRPKNNPITSLIASVGEVAPFLKGEVKGFRELGERFWPGPLTLVVPVQESLIPEVVRAGGSLAGFRIPDHPLALEVLQAVGPCPTPSANPSGVLSSTEPSHVERDFGESFPILDGGICAKGVESTVLIYSGEKWCVGRQGWLLPEEIKSVLGYAPQPMQTAAQKLAHYTSSVTLRKWEGGVVPLLLGYEKTAYPEGCQVMIMGERQNPQSILTGIYALLRQLEKTGTLEAWVDCDLPEGALKDLIFQRLQIKDA